MNNYQLRLRLLRVEARVRALEAAAALRPSPPKREAAPRPDDAVVTAREQLWARYIELEMRFGHGKVKLTKLAFAVRHRLNPDEFCRFFSATDKRGIPEGSTPALRFYQVLREAIAELETRARGGNPQLAAIAADSRGNIAHSQFSGARPQ
jgi:hypothetical protein